MGKVGHFGHDKKFHSSHGKLQISGHSDPEKEYIMLAYYFLKFHWKSLETICLKTTESNIKIGAKI